MRTKGFCWALLRCGGCGEIKLIRVEKRVYAISALNLMANIAIA